MLRRLLATTATVALMTTGAIAADTNKATTEETMATTSGVAFVPTMGEFLASDLMDAPVFAGDDDQAERIGEVGNVILSPEGNVEAVVVDVGGFLGIGEKPVALDFEQASWSRDEDGHGRLTIAVNKDELDNAKAFDPDSLTVVDAGSSESTDAKKTDERAAAKTEMNSEQQPETDMTASVDERMGEEQGDGQSAEQKTAGYGVTNMEKTDPGMTMAKDSEQPATADQRPSIRETLTVVDAVALSADDLIGATVYGTDDENIGEIGDIVLSDKEKIEAYIVEVGGFLGIGEKPVAIDAANLEVMKDSNGNLYVFTPYNAEQLDEQPAYDETAYKENRDANVLKEDK